MNKTQRKYFYFFIANFFLIISINAQTVDLVSYKKGMKEDVYIKDMISYFGSNEHYLKPNSNFQVDKSLIYYSVISRDKENYFTLIRGVYFTPNAKNDTSYGYKEYIAIYFEKGIPYQYQSIRGMFITTRKGTLGQVALTPVEIAKVNKLNGIVIAEQYKTAAELINFQKSKYSTTECKCVSKETIDRSYIKTIEDRDINGRPFTRTKTHTKYGIAFKNNCDYDIVVIAIWKLYDNVKGIYYEDASYKIEANSEIKDPIVINGPNSSRKVNPYTPIEINPVYSDKKNDFDDYQILKIVKARSSD